MGSYSYHKRRSIWQHFFSLCKWNKRRFYNIWFNSNRSRHTYWTADFNGSNNWAGYIDGFRISDIDRYSGTSFVPPSTAYNPDGNTVALLHFDGVNGSTSIENSTGTSVFETDTFPSGVEGTGALGALTFFITTDAPVASVIGTGAVGAEVLEVELNEAGVAGTGEVEGFGVSGNGNIQLIVTGISGIGATGAIGEEVSASEAIETGVSGSGAIGNATVQVFALAWGEDVWGSGSWGE